MKVAILISTLLISGCSLITETIEVPVKVPIVCDKVTVESVETLPVEWQLGRTETGDNVLGLDGENYSNLSINIGRAINHIQTRKEYTESLERCMERFNSEQ